MFPSNNLTQNHPNDLELSKTTVTQAEIRRKIKEKMKQIQSTRSKKHSRCSFLNSFFWSSTSLKSSSLILFRVTHLATISNSCLLKSALYQSCHGSKPFDQSEVRVNQKFEIVPQQLIGTISHSSH